MRAFVLPDDPIEWRRAAGALLGSGLAPSEVQLLTENETGLFVEPLPMRDPPVSVNPAFRKLLHLLLYATSSERHEIAYGVLWRMTHGEPHLLSQPGDPLTARARLLEQAVRREAHKTKSFVRFKTAEDGTLVAFHRPTHRVLRLVQDFFCERFAVERFTIMTPHESLHWDGARAQFGPGTVSRRAGRTNSRPHPLPSASDDEAEGLWLTYYAAIFNPARIKTRAMKAQMPMKHWPTLSETRLIPTLIKEGPARVLSMEAQCPTSARSLALATQTLDDLQDGLRSCDVCPHRLSRNQGCVLRSDRAVPGSGPAQPRLVIVSEQPDVADKGDAHPVLGTGGEVLERALRRAKIRQDEVWLTNAVKHAHYETTAASERRYLRPRPDTIERCRPWLERELRLLGPAPVVCLGRSAALSVLGRRARVSEARTGSFTGLGDRATRVTHHPAEALRRPEDRRRIEKELTEDLLSAAED